MGSLIKGTGLALESAVLIDVEFHARVWQAFSFELVVFLVWFRGRGLFFYMTVFHVSGGQASARTLAPLATPFFHRVMVLLAGYVDMPSW